MASRRLIVATQRVPSRDLPCHALEEYNLVHGTSVAGPLSHVSKVAIKGAAAARRRLGKVFDEGGTEAVWSRERYARGSDRT